MIEAIGPRAPGDPHRRADPRQPHRVRAQERAGVSLRAGRSGDRGARVAGRPRRARRPRCRLRGGERQSAARGADGFLRALARSVAEKGGRLVLDSSGEALRRALEVGAYLIKPNRGELERLLGRALDDPAALEAASTASGRAKGAARSSRSASAPTARCSRPGTAACACARRRSSRRARSARATASSRR